MKKTALTIGLAVLALVVGVFVGTLPKHSTEGYPLTGHTFNTFKGGSLDLAALRGKKVVLNFWATWCPPCVEEMPELSALYPALKAQQVELIGIAVDNTANVNTFLEKTPVSYPVALAGFGGSELAEKLGNSQGGLPFTVVLDEDGNVLMKKAGRIQMSEIKAALDP
ncbi:MAG TPA: TlpA disulfide reductase family protein [Limnobacter sp.]|uniref:TlpA family protein disulfide reductase n=1 Tax=Limnobacter sp. TaxID=2003368 RepID=UPI002E30D85E|nr:TlpA disulfide reductase family protein [Limnobacter sp.]HEX5484569.1 TlpA disulfide reductase family protein [Limnobacter sp.]